jgi:hypothetical protein
MNKPTEEEMTFYILMTGRWVQEMQNYPYCWCRSFTGGGFRFDTEEAYSLEMIRAAD